MNHSLDVMTIADYDEVLALWQITEGVGLNESDTRANIAKFLQRNPDMSFIARSSSGDLIGAVLCGHDGRRGYLHHLAVAKAQRGQGLGKSLLNACLTALKKEGIIKCNIFVYAHNEAGQSFWKHFGWNPRTDLLVMQQNIN